ncbi:MAG: Rne/Rng family ribonuclease [Bacteroidales bacterium]|nr:Rne/Rng family ribonuclease [Bacteroidales bacterium]
MERELVISVSKDVTTIAFLEDKYLVEVHKEKRNKQYSVGDIYLGKVKKIMNGLNAAFIDIGYERDAFLHYNDLGPKFQSYNKYIRTATQHPTNLEKLETLNFLPDISKYGKISEVLTPGQKIMVQIIKEPISSKGPRLTTEVSIAGRNIVLIPFTNKISVSQKIREKEERERLRQLIKSIKPNNFGVIIRTVAKNRRVAVLDSELRGLMQKWNTALMKLPETEVGELLLGELDQTSALLRDVLNSSFNGIYVDDKSTYYEIKDYLNSIAPGVQKILKLYTGGKEDIFEYYGVDKQIKSSFGKIVNLKKGAYLIIEHTEALHVVDVNSGNRTASKTDQQTNAFEVNAMAVDEIARQLRLRDMGGIVVVDFIDMYNAAHKADIFKRMLEKMSYDRTKHSILPLTKFGLMQITRQRVRPEISFQTVEPCPVCEGTGQVQPSVLVVDEIEDTLKHIVTETKPKKLVLKVHPFLYSFFTKGLISIKLKWKMKYKFGLKIEKEKDFHFLEFNFYNEDDKKIQF